MTYEFKHTLNEDSLVVSRERNPNEVEYRFDFVMRNDSLVVNGEGSPGDNFNYSLYIGRVFKGDTGDRFEWSDVTEEEKKEMAESVVKPLLVDLVFKGTPVDKHIQSINGTIPGRVAELEKRMSQIEDLNSSAGLIKALENKVSENSASIESLKTKVNEVVAKMNDIGSSYNDLEERVTVIENKIEVFATEEDINGIII